ncbi:sigma-70 family RNA polymerase sigma factor [Nocardioides sp. R1-1]|uniref:sigma-70 family RNA polymerase sigma factor n=1 Tax=Nocardioides sp. R1-1 TaxID=3383502 RepID=UPI0038D14D83
MNANVTDTVPGTDELISSQMGLVQRLVRETMRRVPSHVSRDDLTSAGLTALVLAARGYDATRGVPFEQYAARRIRGALLDELRSVDWASRSVRRRARDLAETRSRLAVELGRAPSLAEVARAAGLTEADVVANDDDVSRAQVLSLQGPSATPIEDLVPTRAPSPEDLLEHDERLAYLREAIAELPARLRTVVQDYFFTERPMAEIAADLGVTDSRISQMRAEALSLLRDALNHELNREPEPTAPQPASRPRGVAQRRRDSYVAAVAARHAFGLRRGVRPLTAVG